LLAWSSRVLAARRQIPGFPRRQGRSLLARSHPGRRSLVAFDSDFAPMCHSGSGHGPGASLFLHARVPLHEPADRRRGEERSRHLLSIGRGCDNPADDARVDDLARAAARPPGACQQHGRRRGRVSPPSVKREPTDQPGGRVERTSRATSVPFTRVSTGLERTPTDNTTAAVSCAVRCVPR
jgi:hypothetical protein